MTKTYYVGLDVHKETIAIAYATGGTREDSVYHGPCCGSVLAAERALRKLAEKLGVEFTALKVCYEAGPTGFVLARPVPRFYSVVPPKYSPSKMIGKYHYAHLTYLQPYQRQSAGTAGAGVSVETGCRVKVTEGMADRGAPAVVQPRLVRLCFSVGSFHCFLIQMRPPIATAIPAMSANHRRVCE